MVNDGGGSRYPNVPKPRGSVGIGVVQLTLTLTHYLLLSISLPISGHLAILASRGNYSK